MKLKIPSEQEDALLYLIMVILMFGIYIYPVGIPIPVSDMTYKWYNIIQGLKKGDYVLYDESSLNWFTNTQVSIACFSHIKRKVLNDGVKLVVFTTSAPEGQMAMDRMWPVVKFDDMKYGVDWVWLGWLPGGEAAFANIRDDVWKCFKTDAFGSKLEDLPIMQKAHNLLDFKLAIRACNTSPDDFMRQWSGRGVTILCNNGASAIPLMLPYINNGLMTAYMTTMTQCAEYEKLLGYKGLPTIQMDANNLGQFYIIFLITLANIVYWRHARREKK